METTRSYTPTRLESGSWPRFKQRPIVRRPCVDEPAAWLHQAMADRQAAERFVADDQGTGRCHAIAKWQQTLEKSVKALVVALREAGIRGGGVRARHDVERYVGALIRLPRGPGNRKV